MPQEVLKRYENWKDIAMLSGPPGLRAIKGFHDEALSGEWKSHRSSRLGLQWRVIYRVSAIENGRVNLGVERAKVLARALKCHPAVLVFPGWDALESAA